MDALILSCATGGGHNAAGRAVQEEMLRRGHSAVMMDPYSLAGPHVERAVDNGYIRLAQRTPHLFGMIYRLGDGYRRLPGHSPVYHVNKLMRGRMQAFLDAHHFDVILMPHVYPGEILTAMRDAGLRLPPLIFIATDYACIPFTEETACDRYITPTCLLDSDFIRHGIPAERLAPCGIPVQRAFREDITREDALKRLGLDPAKRYLLLSGGSIGAGQIGEALRILQRYLHAHPDTQLTVICGNNGHLLASLQAEYGREPQISLLSSTNQMALYMKGCDVFMSKPGGLSSTEAAVSGTPLIHLSPIPGCETKNMRFFAEQGMSIAVGAQLSRLLPALEQLRDPAAAAQMRARQRNCINPRAAEEICTLAENLAQRKK